MEMLWRTAQSLSVQILEAPPFTFLQVIKQGLLV